MGLLHASILKVIPDVELVALVDKSALMSKVYKKIFASTSIKVMSDFKKLSTLDLDAAYITTPISSHYFIVSNLYKEGIARNMFVEKTLASNYDQAKKLCDFAKKFGSITMVGYMKRFSATFRKAKDLLAQEILGEPHSFKAYAYSSDFLGLTKKSQSSASRGGALRDIGCHVVDLALWLLGDLKVNDVLSDVNDIDSATSVSFTTQNSCGLEVQFDVSQRMLNYRMPEFGLTIEGSKGKIEVNDDRLLLTLSNGSLTKWYKQDLSDNVAFFLGEAEYYRENQHFVSSLLNNQMSEPNFESASRVDNIINQVINRSRLE